VAQNVKKHHRHQRNFFHGKNSEDMEKTRDDSIVEASQITARTKEQIEGNGEMRRSVTGLPTRF